MIDSDFIDVVFDEHAHSNHLTCGMIPPAPEDELYASGLRSWEAAGMPIYQRGEWSSRIKAMQEAGSWATRYIKRIFNQSSEPSCVYNAAGQALEICWNRQFGIRYSVPVSPISGYRYNGSRTSGSSVPGAAKWLSETGLLPLNSPDNQALVTKGYFSHVHPHTGYGVEPKTGWKTDAVLFRSDEWLSIKSVDQWVSALLCGFPCIGGRDGHCICHTELAMEGGRMLSVYVNSWNGWGSEREIGNSLTARGFGADSQGKVETMVGRGAWCLRTVLRPSFVGSWKVAT